MVVDRIGGRLAKIVDNAISPLVMLDPLTAAVLRFFDDDQARQLRYERLWDYYTGDQYTQDAIRRRTQERGEIDSKDASGQLHKLYEFTRLFYNVVKQCVDTDVQGIFRDPTEFQAVAEGQQETLDTLVEVSKLEARRFNIVRFGGATGDVYLRVGTDAVTGKAKLYVHAPDTVRLKRNPFDMDVIDWAVMSYEYLDQEDRKIHTRIDAYFPDRVETYRDGRPFDYDGNGSTYPNLLGVVPFWHIQHQDIDMEYGLPTCDNILPTLDVVNEIMSFMMNIVRINADPQMVAYGMKKGDLQKGDATSPTAAPIWYLPNARADINQKVELIEWKGNLPDVLGILKEVKTDVANTMPQMHVLKMMEQGAYSGQALNAMLLLYVQSITESRVRYRGGVEPALSASLALQDILDGKTTTATVDLRDPRYKTKINLPTVLPVDEDALYNRVLALFEAGAIGLEELHLRIGTPKDQIEEILRKAEEDKQRAQERAMELKAAAAPAGGQEGSRDNNNANRAKASRRAGAGANNQPTNNQLKQ